jgi:ubiquinone biosynthesis protein UbiJ
MKNASPDSSSFSAGPGAAPLNFLQSLLGAIRPPDWVVDELQNRVVLFLNHVLMQESAAQERLRRQKGKPVRIQWGDFHLTLAPTPAGLLERAAPDAQPELTVTVAQASPIALAQRVLAGDKPAVDIRGDVQLAAEVAWLVDNVRWDVEEDLSRFVGDATAHTLGRFARSAAQAVRAFVARMPGAFAPSTSSEAPPATGAGQAGGSAGPAA